MAKDEKMVQLPPPSLPRLSKEHLLTLADIDRMAHLFSLIADEWRGELIAHGKVGEESFGISAETPDLSDLLKKFGSLREVEYVSMSVPGKFILDFDFAKGKLFVRSDSPALLRKFEQQWRESQMAVSPSKSMLLDVASTEARKFIVDHTAKGGTLYESGRTPVDLGKAYYLTALKPLGLIVLLEKLSDRLLSTQNKDGGWGRNTQKKSDALSTANALLLLSSISNESPIRSEAVERGKIFLLSKRRADGSWNVNWMRAAGTSLCLLALKKVGARSPTLRKSLEFSRQGIQLELNESFHDLVLLEELKDAGVLGAEKIGRLNPESAVGENEDVVHLATLLGLAGISNASLKRRRIIQDELLAQRNLDGGWPVKKGGRSELYPTVLVLYALQYAVKNEERVD